MTEPCKCKGCASKSPLVTTDSVTASGFFTTEQIGKKQSFTPEGFLLCESVPIARIGTQDYAAIELPDLEDKDGVIEVERDPEVVFSPETIGSFIGKPVTIDHPNDPVTPTNWSVLAKGGTHNVRRGEGELSDFLVADLLITDKGAINDVVSKRLSEISCGYESDYEQIAPGRARQVSIVGNHVALVKSARCGPACSITADSPKLLGETPMAVKKPAQASSLMDKLRKAFMTRDTDEFEKTLSEVKDEDMSGDPAQHIHIHMPGDGDAKEETKDEADDPMAKVAASLDALTTSISSIAERVSALESGKTSDSDEKVDEKKEETKDADGDDEGDGDETMDSDDEEEKKDDKKSTKDSASFKDEFQDAKARAEILAPGVKLPTFDAKADGKKTSDAICVLRRRALRAGLENSNADLVRAITGDADVSKITCDAAKMAFHAASELVKQKNKQVKTATADAAANAGRKDINQVHADFWATRKA